jgi:DNA-binding transcriptional ArsR family regulator
MSKIKWEEAAECLRVLSHPHRLQMIDLLLREELSVGEIAAACGILQNVASEHLKLMHRKGFLRLFKRGRKVFYAIQETALTSIMMCIEKRFKQNG